MKLTSLISAMCLLLAGFSVQASIQMNTTRVIYNAADKDVSVQVTNPGEYPVLLQSWIDAGDPNIKPEKIKTPFILTPPLSRVNEKSGQTLRLSLIDRASLPAGRESVFWLNVLEIPPLDNKNANQIQVAFRTRIKLFYRPEGLNSHDAGEAVNQLRWDVRGNNINVANPTPYYVSLNNLTVKNSNKERVITADMIAPQSQKEFSIPAAIHISNTDSIFATSINDYGATSTKPISHQ